MTIHSPSGRPEAQRKWRKANPDKVRKYNRKAYLKNQKARIAYTRKWREDHPSHYTDNKVAWNEAARRNRYKRNYGIEVNEYEKRLVEQGGGCALCGAPPGVKRLYVDHCHTTGLVRGLLCLLCNTGIGKLQDNPDLLRKAAAYIEAHQ